MYNSSIIGQSTERKFSKHFEIENEVFFNDMSKNYIHPSFRGCDCMFSEISWTYGYRLFNDRAENEPSSYADYMNNIVRLIRELNIPTFIVCGRFARKYFYDAQAFPIRITTSDTNMDGCILYVWNYDYDGSCKNTSELTTKIASEFHKCLDFSCGYGEHLMKFDDFVGCDINRDCLTYLSILKQERSTKNV